MTPAPVETPAGPGGTALVPARAAGTTPGSVETLVGARPAELPWTRRHVLDLDDFAASEIEAVMETTDAMREVLNRDVPRLPTLRGTTVATLFYEASTRTRASFELAGKALGADVINVSASGSSVEKGESLIDTVRTLQAIGVDVLVMRHGSSGAPYLAARNLNAAVINGGDGWHAHPTQALLDLYTMRQHLGDLHGRTVTIVGDILHSRVARSNLWGLTAMGARVVVCAPPTLLPAGLGRTLPDGDELGLPPVHVEHDLRRALDGADVVMTLRLQKERMHSGLIPSLREYSRRYEITTDSLRYARPGALVMHPGPMNEGVEIAPDVAYGLQSRIEEQVTNGVAVRMALLYLIRGGRRSAAA
ncbi:MAG: aspartate carbamoyltransferase catalytic subunit [Chloroflexi bacterium]|nr:aspartate carbamoyltransferase catalytic subunit [Chloroflexota bacterium]